MPYTRVIPRDLFNEAKLLKGWGFVALLIHNETAPDGVCLEHNNSSNPGFEISQDPGSADLEIDNLTLMLYNKPIRVTSSYNKKTPNTLYFESECGEFDGPLLTDDGKWSDEFLNYCSTIKATRILQQCGL